MADGFVTIDANNKLPAVITAELDAQYGGSLTSLLTQPTTGVTVERVSADQHYLYSELSSGYRIRWDLSRTRPSRGGDIHQIRNVHSIPKNPVSVDDVDTSITYTGGFYEVGSTTPVSGTYGGSFHRSATTGDYAQWTTQATDALGIITSKVLNMGIATVTLDGSATAANVLPTAQDLVNAGRCPASALTTAGGTLDPATRCLETYTNRGTEYANYIPFANGLADTAHTVRVTVTGYKHPSSTDVRVEVDGFYEGQAVTERLSGIGSVWEYALNVEAGGVTEWIGNDHGGDYQTGLSIEIDGATASLIDGQQVSGSSAVITRTSDLAHSGISSTPGSAGTVTCEYRIEGNGLTVTWAWTPAFTSSGNKLEYPMAGLNTETDSGFTRGRTLAMDSTSDLGSHDGTLSGVGTVTGTAALWQKSGRFACLVHVPEQRRTFAGHTMSVYLQDRLAVSGRPDLNMAKAYFEHLGVSVTAGEIVRSQAIYRFAELPNSDLSLTL